MKLHSIPSLTRVSRGLLHPYICIQEPRSNGQAFDEDSILIILIQIEVACHRRRPKCNPKRSRRSYLVVDNQSWSNQQSFISRHLLFNEVILFPGIPCPFCGGPKHWDPWECIDRSWMVLVCLASWAENSIPISAWIWQWGPSYHTYNGRICSRWSMTIPILARVVINCHVLSSCMLIQLLPRKFAHCDRHRCLYGQQHQSHDGHVLPAANGLVGAGLLHFWILLGHQYDSLETRLDFQDCVWSFRFIKYDVGSQCTPQELS